MVKRLGLLAFAVLGFALAVPNIAYGYIDPATTSYIIQLVAGLVISLSVAFGVFFRRLQMSFVTIKARISATLSSLASKRKRHTTDASNEAASSAESDDASVAAKSTISNESKRSDVNDRAPFRKIGGAIDWKGWQEATKAAEKQKLKDQPFKLSNWLFADDRSFKQRLLLALILAGALSVTYLVCSPLDILTANASFIPFTFDAILPYILLAGLIGFAIMSVVLLITRGRIFDFLASLMFGALIMFWVQGSFMNPSLGMLAGDLIDWSQHTTRAVVTTIICLVILAIPFLLAKLSKKVWKNVVLYGSGLMIVVQLISIITVTAQAGVLTTGSGSSDDEAVFTNEALYEVSANENIIVLLVDRTDGRFRNDILAEDPTFFDNKFDGFTCFTGYSSYYNLTFPSVVNMLTGKQYDFDNPTAPSRFMNTAYEESDFLSDLHDAGYSNYLYLDRFFSYYNAAPMSEEVENVSIEEQKIKPVMALKRIYRLTGFVYMPQIIKPSFWLNTSDFYAGVSYGDMYELNDHTYYNKLLNDGLTIGGDDKRFSFIHLSGTHSPYTWSSDMQEIPAGGEGTELDSARATYKIVFEYIEELKRLGLYESSTIIVTADHGRTFSINDVPCPTALYVKPAGSANTPMTYNNAPVTFENFRATVINAAGGDMQGYADTYFEVPEDEQLQRTLNYRYSGTEKGSTVNYEIEVTGDYNDINNWRIIREMPFDYSGEVGGL